MIWWPSLNRAVSVDFFFLMASSLKIRLHDDNMFSLVSEYELSLRSHGLFSKASCNHVPKSVLYLTIFTARVSV